MVNKTCKGCGWVYPPSYNEARCRFCGTAFEERVCPECGKLGKPYKNAYCRDCYNKLQREGTHDERMLRYRAKRIKSVEEQYAEWLEQIKDMPFTPLTEEQWLTACRYFGGCALCDTSEIEARGYFIRFEDGGKYTAWNILPLCEKCATELKKQHNPFRRLDTQLNGNLPQCRGVNLKKLRRATKYLQERIDEQCKMTE